MKKIIITLSIIAVILFIIKQKDMTWRQSILKALYPLVMWFSRSGDIGTILNNDKNILPQRSFYDLSAISINGDTINFSTFKGKKVLIVNTASNCGYTEQYNDLEKLYKEQKGNLIVLGFPANDFKEQEKGSDDEIAKFCKQNFGVTFPLMRKSSVVKGYSQHEVFQWLTDKNKNGWNSQQPVWNFSKYLINENGVLVNYFGTAISPVGDEIQKAILK